jgi:hypothetical protein
MVRAIPIDPPNTMPPPLKRAMIRRPPPSAAHAANCRASERLSARAQPTRLQRARVDTTRRVRADLTQGAVPRPRVAVARLRGGVATRRAARAGATARRLLMHRVVKAGHPKIVAVLRVSAKALMIHVVATAHRATAHHGHDPQAVTRAEQVPLAQAAAREVQAAVTAQAATLVTIAAPAAERATADAATMAARVVKIPKEAAHRARGGVNGASHPKVVVATPVAAIRGAAVMTAVRPQLHHAQALVAATMRVAQTARHARAAGVIAMR